MNNATGNGVTALCLKMSQFLPAVKFLVFTASFALALHCQSYGKEAGAASDKNATDSFSRGGQ